MKHVIVPQEDIDKLEEARQALHRAMDALRVHPVLYGHITQPMIVITHKKYPEDYSAELIATLENILHYMDTDDMRMLDLRLARAAIAKAKGEQK